MPASHRHSIGGPITDTVGVRLWASYKRAGRGFVTQREQEPYGVTKDTSISGTLTFEATEDLNLKLTGYYTKADDTGLYGGIDATQFGVAPGSCNIVYTGNYYNNATMELTPFTRDLSQFPGHTWCGNFPDGKNQVGPYTIQPGPGDNQFGDAGLNGLTALNPFLEKYGIIRNGDGKLGANNQTYRFQFSGDYDLGDHTLSFQASRANTGLNNIRDFRYGVPNVPMTVAMTGINSMMRETYFEARVASPQEGRLRYLIGVSDYTQRYRLGGSPTRGADVSITTTTQNINFQDNTTTAVFGSIDYDITDELTLSVEGRYTDESSDVIVQGNPSNPCGFSPVCNLRNEYDDFIPRVILNYNIFDGANTYVSWSESSLLGLPTQAGFVAAVAPEVLSIEQATALGNFTGVQRNTQYEWG